MIDWDRRKRQANLKKHGFDFVDANEVFDGVTFTYEDDHIRVISMRKATKYEREIYFQNISN